MAKLSFIGELDERQTEYANKIAEKAKEMGIPPALAVSIAYHESRLNPDAPRGKSGEFGIMQVMPATGKGMGFTNKDLADPEKNIEAGLKYLKQNLDAFGGDSKMATVGYNAGTDSPFFSGGALPKTTEDYVKAMKGYGAYDADRAEETVADSPTVFPGDMESVPKPPDQPEEVNLSGADKASRFLFGGIGAGAGTAVAGTGAAVNALDNRAVNLAGKVEAAKIAAQRAAGAPPAPAAPTAPGAAPPAATKPPVGSTIMRQPIPSGGPDAGRLATGQTGTMPYNYAKAAGLTDIEAGRALDMTKQAGGVHDLTTQRREGMNKVQNMFPGEKYVENPRFGGLLTPEQSVGSGPRAYGPPSIQAQASQAGALPMRETAPYQIGGAKPTPIPTTTPFSPKSASGLDAVTDMFKGMMRPVATAVKTFGRYAMPPLAGLSAGLDVAETAHEYDKPDAQRDYTKMGLKAASALGGGLSMFPNSAPVGIPLSLGASGIQAYRENPNWLSEKMKGMANTPLLEEMTGPIP